MRICDPCDFATDLDYFIYQWTIKGYLYAAEHVKGKTVLDCGCGQGYGTFQLARKAEKAVGVDLSDWKMDRSSKFKSPNLQFKKMDILKMSFKDDSFDLVVSSHNIEHLEEYEKSVREMHRVLKAGGKCIVITPNGRIRKLSGGKPYSPFHVIEFESQELKALMEKHFSQVEVLGLRGNWRAQDIELRRLNRRGNPLRKLHSFLRHADFFRLRRFIPLPFRRNRRYVRFARRTRSHRYRGKLWHRQSNRPTPCA